MAVLELSGPSLAMQHFLYFLPLPQGQGAFRSAFTEASFYMPRPVDGESSDGVVSLVCRGSINGKDRTSGIAARRLRRLRAHNSRALHS